MLTLDVPNSTAEAVCALLIYKFSGSGDMDDTIFATRHSLNLDAGRPTVGLGEAFTHSDLVSLLKLMEGKDLNEQALLPNTLLGISGRHLIWFVPSKMQRMWFTGNLNVPNDYYEMLWPNLIFLVVDNRLSVCACAGNQRPDNQTKLFHAPLMNVYDSTAVCVGNAMVPSAADIDSMLAWEKIIYDTRFTHINDTLPLRNNSKTKKDKNAIYLDWVKTKSESKRAVVASELCPLNHTLETYLKWQLNKSTM